MRVVLRDQAYADLDNIFTWIAKDRLRSAHAVVDRILESTERLGSFPYLGHAGDTSGTLEWVVPGLPYIVVYRINEDDHAVDVVAILHGAQERKP